jgi:uncharacterized membrane protein YdbT with pleckstrin-like domain
MSEESDIRGGTGTTLTARLHWVVLLGPTAVFVFGGLSLRSKGASALVLMAIGALWGLLSFMTYRRSEITLTADRLHIQTGFLFRKSYDVLLKEIVAVDLYQPSLGALLNFGKLIVIHGRRARSTVRMVASPVEFVMELKRRLGTIHSQE